LIVKFTGFLQKSKHFELAKVIYLIFETQCIQNMRLLQTICKAGIVLLFLFPGMVNGQISKGGTPVHIENLKSVSPTDLIILPPVDNNKLRKASSVNPDQSMLKPLRFAYPFDVSLNLKNSGKWYSDGEMKVWQLRIRSVGAYSLNVIFSRFNLPENVRLYLIGTNNGEIKGAYTSANNSPSQVLAVEPLAGDEILIQYEEPVGVAFPGEIEISRVSHDFIGIKSYDPRIPLGTSGTCNVNVNCDIANGTEDIRDAVCRIIIGGTEICTGTLINNTLLDGTPYLLTAYHCIGTESNANTSVFLFNFESPYCTSIVGDVSRSLSGSSLKASFDSLDFALVRLNNSLPYNYRPYFAGWNRKNIAPSSSVSIHHPLGDIKKISIDKDAAITYKFSSSYLNNGFWNILRWDYGVTENGSSGGPLFDQNKQLIGTLTGGAATCSLPEDDYFEKFALAWDYRKETSKQLKSWLDPINSNVEKLNGMSPYSGITYCKPITNFKESDTYSAVQISNGLTKKGYFSGTNLSGFTDFAEQYTFSKSCEIQGITLGIAKAKTNPAFTQAFINVQVYEGTDKPTILLYSQKFDIKKFFIGGMNYLPFQTSVKTTGNFFISYNIQELNQGDTIAVYMANRKTDVTNSFWLKNSTGWLKYNSQNISGNGSALLTELVACNIDFLNGLKTIENELVTAKFYPNPLNGNSFLTVKTVQQIECPQNTTVFDLLGKDQNISCVPNGPNELLLNFSGKRPGIYFVHIEAGGRQMVGKIAYMP
jgi:lysyl endopeptidase